jgi:SPP1 family phage portal protein
MLAVQELKDENDQQYYLCFSETKEYKIQNGKVISSKLHAFGGIPIVEYPNNYWRLSDIELVIDLLDAVNNYQSNRLDAVEQFVQSWVKFVNCDIDKDTFEKMKMMGALVVKSNNGENKADVDVITQELNQTESQVAKDDILENALSILAIPSKRGNGGDRQGAVELRNGWDFSKTRAKMKDAIVKASEKRLAKVVLNILRQQEMGLGITIRDFDIQINHSPLDNLIVKCQALQYLLECGIHPQIAISKVGLFEDPEKAYLASMPYLDAKYKTIDDVERAEQESKADELLSGFEKGVKE